MSGMLPTEEWDLLAPTAATVDEACEEYARHLGHADLLRESIDGWRGE